MHALRAGRQRGWVAARAGGGAAPAAPHRALLVSHTNAFVRSRDTAMPMGLTSLLGPVAEAPAPLERKLRGAGAAGAQAAMSRQAGQVRAGRVWAGPGTRHQAPGTRPPD